MPEKNFSKIRYAYIIGIGRSGTTLLASLFNKHKNCLVSPEIEFIIFFNHQFSKQKNFTEKDYKSICDFFDAFAIRHPMLKILLNTEILFSDLCKSNIRDYNSLTKFIHLRFNFFNKPVDDIQVILEKNMSYTLYIDKLISFSPEAKFIYMIRDYRANILSRKQSIEYRSPNTAYNCYRWLLFNKRARRFMMRSSNRLVLLRYEDLVVSKEEQIEMICDHLGLSKESADLNYYTPEQSTILSENLSKIKRMNERYNKIFSDIEKPVFKNRIEKWKDDLSEKDIKIAEVICGKFGKHFGYERTMKIPFPGEMIIRIKSFPFLIRAIYDFYKEFLLYYVSPEIKIKRIKQMNHQKIIK